YQHGALPVELAARVISTWQGRKDSNPRPSVLETDALTRLSYAPNGRRQILPSTIEPWPPLDSARLAPKGRIGSPDWARLAPNGRIEPGDGRRRPPRPDRRRRPRRPRAAVRGSQALPCRRLAHRLRRRPGRLRPVRGRRAALRARPPEHHRAAGQPRGRPDVGPS